MQWKGFARQPGFGCVGLVYVGVVFVAAVCSGCGDPSQRAALQLQDAKVRVTTRRTGSKAYIVDVSRRTLNARQLELLPQLTPLEVLYARHCRQADLLLRALQKNVSLRTLDLHASNLADAQMPMIATFRRLRVLNLSQTAVTDEGLRFVSQLSELQELAAPPQITDRGLKCLADLRALRQLYLGETKVRGPGLRYLSRLPKLQTLRCGDTDLSDDAAEALVECRSLQRLVLSRTQVGDATVARLAELTELDYLALEETRVTDAGLMQLARHPRLYILDLYGAAVTERGIKRFRALAPRVRVTWRRQPDRSPQTSTESRAGGR